MAGGANNQPFLIPLRRPPLGRCFCAEEVHNAMLENYGAISVVPEKGVGTIACC